MSRITMKMRYKTQDGKEHIGQFVIPFSEYDGTVYFMQQICIKNDWTYIKAVQTTFRCSRCGKPMRKGADILVRELDNDLVLTPRNIDRALLCKVCYDGFVKYIKEAK